MQWQLILTSTNDIAHAPNQTYDVNVTPLTASDSVLARQRKGELAVIVAGGFFRKEGGGSITGKTKRAGHKSTGKNEHP